MQEKMNLLENLKTWELLCSPTERKAVNTKVMFDAKRDGEGHVGRSKARLVAKGFSHIEGIDFQDFCAPVARFTKISPVLSLSVTFEHVSRVPDVKIAFNNGPLKETICLSQLDGFVCNEEQDRVHVVKKALCGPRHLSHE